MLDLIKRGWLALFPSPEPGKCRSCSKAIPTTDHECGDCWEIRQW